MTISIRPMYIKDGCMCKNYRNQYQYRVKLKTSIDRNKEFSVAPYGVTKSFNELIEKLKNG